jgi:hypothetical protein
MKYITNHVPRPLIDAYTLTPTEREEFDYLDWPAIDRGEDSATFFRYRGDLYDLGTFTRMTATPGWDGGSADTVFSATLVKIIDDETVIVGRCYE